MAIHVDIPDLQPFTGLFLEELKSLTRNLTQLLRLYR